jgi:hypothetical protein
MISLQFLFEYFLIIVRFAEIKLLIIYLLNPVGQMVPRISLDLKKVLHEFKYR